MRNLDPVLHPAQPLTVDCSANPYDLRPAVAGIVARVEQVSNHLRSIGSHQKIVVIMGEAHPMPSHILLQAAVLKALQEKHRLVFGYEEQHDFLGRAVEIFLDEDLSYAEKAALRDLDHDGKKSIMGFLSFFKAPLSPVATNLIKSFMLNSTIPYVATDAAGVRGKAYILDRNDPLTKSFIPKQAWYSPLLGRDISMILQRGLAIRNKMMAHLTADFMKAHDADIGVQHCGKVHVLGRDYPFPFNFLSDKYENSLHAVFSQAGLLPIPVFLECKAFRSSKLSREGLNALNDGIPIIGLAEDKFKLRRKVSLKQALDECDERTFIKKMLIESKLDLELFSPTQQLNVWKLFGKGAPLWLAKARACSPTEM